MKFNLIDRITDYEPGSRLRATKSLSLAEEYLSDHFATFPVMPGVLMIECMTQAASWLVRLSSDFAHSVLVLASVKNATFKSFIAPGDTLTVEVACRVLKSNESEFQGTGYCGQREIVKARVLLRHYNLVDQDPEFSAIDRELIIAARRQLELVGGEKWLNFTTDAAV